MKVQKGNREAFRKFFAFFLSRKKVGVFNVQGPPVPIPNTVVKLHCVDNTQLATAREDRSMPTQNSVVSDSNAQGPPVPIPNTVVKLCCAENTQLATARENRSLLTHNSVVSDFSAQGPPVPIPNTVVKLCCAENTQLATARENRSSLTRRIKYSSLAQSAEHLTVNQGVTGSSPVGGAIYVVRKDYNTQKSLIFKDFSCF